MSMRRIVPALGLVAVVAFAQPSATFLPASLTGR